MKVPYVSTRKPHRIVTYEPFSLKYLNILLQPQEVMWLEKYTASYIAYCISGRSRTLFPFRELLRKISLYLKVQHINVQSTNRFNMNLFCHYKTRCLKPVYTSVALPILFQIHRIYHSTKKSNVTHNIKHIKHKLLENKNLYISATENKRNKT